VYKNLHGCTLTIYMYTRYWSGESKSSWLYFNHIHVHMLLNWRIKIFMVVLYTCTISSNIMFIMYKWSFFTFVKLYLLPLIGISLFIHVHMLLNWRIKIFMVVLYTCTISSNINAWLHSKVRTLVHPLIRQRYPKSAKVICTWGRRTLVVYTV
jgi:phosphotransferase system  glucose/maltose/N-acetylglucosamine-specific IIC component